MPPDNPEAVFKAWLDEHGGIICRVARIYARSADDRQDLAQEILLQLWRSLPRYEGKASPCTWVYRVALNTALAWGRAERRRRQRQVRLLDVEETPAVETEPGERYRDRETLEQLYAAIHRLPKVDAAVLLLYLDDLGYREMAEVLGISENHVGVKLNRARKALAQLLKEVLHDP